MDVPSGISFSDLIEVHPQLMDTDQEGKQTMLPSWKVGKDRVRVKTMIVVESSARSGTTTRLKYAETILDVFRGTNVDS